MGSDPSITVDTGEAERVLAALSKLPRAVRRQVGDAVRQSAQDVAREARAILRSGRAKGEPSAPGHAPARQSGVLARSIRVRRSRRDGLAYSVASEFYGRFLEIGAERGAKGGRLDPRPFLTLARDRRAETARARIGAAIRAAFAEVGVA
ncbi:MAG TPA: HK97 gp10 family phage protein [Azospirillaceae bacterium]|nr:HK97 gp10 family phage protein [Azospirillaceae bacterium]